MQREVIINDPDSVFYTCLLETGERYLTLCGMEWQEIPGATPIFVWASKDTYEIYPICPRCKKKAAAIFKTSGLKKKF